MTNSRTAGFVEYPPARPVLSRPVARRPLLALALTACAAAPLAAQSSAPAPAPEGTPPPASAPAAAPDSAPAPAGGNENYLTSTLTVTADATGCASHKDVMIIYYTPGLANDQGKIILTDFGQAEQPPVPLCTSLRDAFTLMGVKTLRGKKVPHAHDNPTPYYEGRTFVMSPDELAAFKTEHTEYVDHSYSCTVIFTDTDEWEYTLQLFSGGRAALAYWNGTEKKPFDRDLGMLTPAQIEILRQAFEHSNTSVEAICSSKP